MKNKPPSYTKLQREVIFIVKEHQKNRSKKYKILSAIRRIYGIFKLRSIRKT